jgi:hypothetical protein
VADAYLNNRSLPHRTIICGMNVALRPHQKGSLDVTGVPGCSRVLGRLEASVDIVTSAIAQALMSTCSVFRHQPTLLATRRFER